MADDESTKNPILYGSAGMAASGMMPGSRKKPRPAEEAEEMEEGNPVEAEEVSVSEDPAVETSSRPKKPESVAPPADPGKAVEPSPAPATPAFQGLRAAVIGHTGAGDFGSHLDVVFQRLDGVRLEAICDGDAGAVDEAQIRTGAPHGYHDFRRMLEEEKPDIVSVATRSSAQHVEMVRASLESGAHVLCEAPFTQTLKEADELIALAEERNLKVAVAHPLRVDPHVIRFQEECHELIGELLEMHLFGKMDAGAGGEDLLLNGAPLFDLARLFAGEPSYCTASVTKEGIPAIAEDAHESQGNLHGPLLGDTIRAQFAMESGVHVTFLSDSRQRGITGPTGIEFIGEKGIMRLFANQPPIFSRLANSNPGSHTRSEVWQLWPQVQGPYHKPVDKLTQLDAANRLLVKDWIAAIGEDRPPLSSGDDGRRALEMVHGVWQAAVTMKRAYFPLVNRLHPLSEESA